MQNVSSSFGIKSFPPRHNKAPKRSTCLNEEIPGLNVVWPSAVRTFSFLQIHHQLFTQITRITTNWKSNDLTSSSQTDTCEADAAEVRMKEETDFGGVTAAPHCTGKCRSS